MGMIGECMDDNDDICGAVVSRRKVADKVSVWNRDKNDEDTIMRIGFVLGHIYYFILFYMLHRVILYSHINNGIGCTERSCGNSSLKKPT